MADQGFCRAKSSQIGSNFLSSERYRVPKRKVQAILQSRDLGDSRGYIFLSYRVEGHQGQERPSDLLNSQRPFIVFETESGKIFFVSRHHIAVVLVPIEEELGCELSDPQGQDPDGGQEARISITLQSGRALQGLVRYQLPASQSRIQDFLNLNDPFISLLQEDSVALVNKELVSHITPLHDRGETTHCLDSTSSSSRFSSTGPTG